MHSNDRKGAVSELLSGFIRTSHTWKRGIFCHLGMKNDGFVFFRQVSTQRLDCYLKGYQRIAVEL